MKDCYAYALLAPPLEHFIDEGSVQPLLSIPFILKDERQWEIAILGRPNQISAVRMKIPDTNGLEIDPEDFKRFQIMRSFILDCIKINYDPSCEYFRQGDDILSFWIFVEPNGAPNVNLKINVSTNDEFRVNAEGLKALLTTPQSMRTVIHLLADGTDFRLPLQFRFLSVYKVIELHYKISTNQKFNLFIGSFLSDFKQIEPSVNTIGNLCKYLNKLRAKCAHIELSDGELGFSHPKSDLSDAKRAFPLLQRIAAKCIHENYPGSLLRIAITPEEGAEVFKQMEREGLKPIKVAG